MITLIACTDQNRGIGYKGELLAHLPNDLRHFKNHTEGKICVQGRKTYESIIAQTGQDLPNRTNVVLTKDKKYQAERGAYVFHSVKEIINNHKNYGDEQEIMVIGGEEIYKQFLPFANKILLTIIHHSFEKSDTLFPQFSLSDWQITSHKLNKADAKHLYDFSFVTYERKSE